MTWNNQLEIEDDDPHEEDKEWPPDEWKTGKCWSSDHITSQEGAEDKPDALPSSLCLAYPKKTDTDIGDKTSFAVIFTKVMTNVLAKVDDTDMIETTLANELVFADMLDNGMGKILKAKT